MIAISTRSLGYASGATERSMPLTSSVWFRHSSSSRITGSSCRGGSVVVANRAWIRATVSSPVRRATAASASSVSERVEDRLVARVDLGVAGDPRAQRGPARRDRR